VKSAIPESEAKPTSNLIDKKPVRPQTSIIRKTAKGSVGNARELKLNNITPDIPHKYRIQSPLDILGDSTSNFSGLDSLGGRTRTVTSAQGDMLSSSKRDRPFTGQPYLMPYSPQVRIQQHLDQDIHSVAEQEQSTMGRSQSTNSKRVLVVAKPLPGKAKQNSVVVMGSNKKSEHYVKDYVSIYSGQPRLKISASSLSTKSSVKLTSNATANKYIKYISAEDEYDQRELDDRVESLMNTQPQTTKNSNGGYDM